GDAAQRLRSAVVEIDSSHVEHRSASQMTPTPTLPLSGLRDSRILPMSSEGIACQGGGELGPASAHGLWSGFSIIAVPTSQARCDPCDEGQRAGGMRIFLLGSGAFEFARKPFECDSEIIVDDIAGWTGAAVPGVDQLNSANGSGERDCGKIEQPLGIDDLAVFQGEALTLERAEELFDPPAQAIEIGDLLGISRATDCVGGQQPPQQCCLA